MMESLQHLNSKWRRQNHQEAKMSWLTPANANYVDPSTSMGNNRAKKKREASSISEAHVRDLISLSRLFLPIPSVRIVYPGLVFNTHKKSVENVGKIE